MRYVLRQKMFSFGNDFTIKDETGRDVFFIDGKTFTIGEKLSFQDMQGNELVFIKQKLLSWGPTYELHSGGQLVAVVKKAHFTLFRYKFSIDVPGPDDLEAHGDFFDREYSFTRRDREVAQVSKRFFSLTDTYGVEVAPGENDVLILATAVVIDMIAHDQDNK